MRRRIAVLVVTGALLTPALSAAPALAAGDSDVVRDQRSDAMLDLDEGATAAATRPIAQPRAIDDSCPTGRVAASGFADVPADNVHAAAVDCVVHWQLTTGKTATGYAPAEMVSREQMASFLARLLQRSGLDLPPASRDFFGDDSTSFHQDNINRLAQVGLVGGKSVGVYDPRGGVSRAQMAAFLTRAYDYRAVQAGHGSLPAGGDHFDDDDAQLLQPEIDKAAAAGFTGGVAPLTYRPAGVVRRDQMASFLARVLDLIVQNEMTSVPPAPPTAFPDTAPAVHGGTASAVYLAVTLEADDSAHARAQAQAREAGYDDIGFGDINCDSGAREQLGLDPARPYWRTALYFVDRRTAERFVDLYGPEVVGIADVTTYCLD